MDSFCSFTGGQYVFLQLQDMIGHHEDFFSVTTQDLEVTGW